MFMDIVRDSEMKVKVDTAGCLWACSVTGRLMKLRIDRCGNYGHAQLQAVKWR
jgi:hypothetical protein